MQLLSKKPKFQKQLKAKATRKQRNVVNTLIGNPREQTPPKVKSSTVGASVDSGLAIRRSSVGNTRAPQRVKRANSGARKRFKTK